MAEPSPGFSRHRRLWLEVATQAVALGGLLWGLRVCLQYLDPYREQREQARKRAAFLKQHLGRALELNEFEQLLAANVMNPSHIDVSIGDVNGLEHIVEDLEFKVLYPMLQPRVYCTTLWRQTRGVLLYGPPGTGKTMLAKALAKQSGCFFLNITASAIMSKWLGDANRLVRAVFSLAEKLEPCIIFIDEVDAMLGKRGATQEHEATLQVKTEFMTLWDGMESGRGQRVVVMGATNRPWMVDEAVLRRFTLQYEIGLPNEQQRRAILLGYMRRHAGEVPDSVSAELLKLQPAAADAAAPGTAAEDPSASAAAATAVPGPALDWVAKQTDGFSGSDIMELCAQAAQRVLSDYWRQQRSAPLTSSSSAAEATQAFKPRAMCRADFVEALKDVHPSTRKAEEYNRTWSGTSFNSAGGGTPSPTDAAQALALLLSLRNNAGGSS